MIHNRLTSGLARMVALGLILVFVPACAYLVGSWSRGEKSPRDTYVFSHNKHAVVEKIDCADCHGGVAKNKSLDEKREIPHKCDECHDTPATYSKETATLLESSRVTGVIFSHEKHLTLTLPADATPVSCDSCHGSIKEAKKISDYRLDLMELKCVECHKTDFDKENCDLCHKAGSLRNTDTKALWKYLDHSGDWLHRHGSQARGTDQTCAHCHKVETCAECHSRSNVPMRPSQLRLNQPDSMAHHRGDWISRHPMEAKLDSKSCQVCHQLSSCKACHDRFGVGQTGALGSKTSPHPGGWLLRGSGESHGDAARRDAVSCAACHDRGAASNCVTCHRIGAPGGNPHPAGWQSNQDKATSPACTPCHQ